MNYAPPAPAPVMYVEIDCSEIIEHAPFELAWAECCVFAAFMLLMSLYIIGILRRRCRFGRLRFFAWFPYSVLSFLIPYIVGLIRKNGYKGRYAETQIWAVFLLFIYGSLDNFNALNLDDRRRVRMILFKDLLYAFILLAVLVIFPSGNPTLLPLILVIVLAKIKLVERTMGLVHATCDTSPLRSWLMMIAKHWKDDQVDQVGFSGRVQGCRYLVGESGVIIDEDKIVRGVTIREIWQCHDDRRSILSLTRDPGNRLKDTCLSFSLFWLLLRKFAGFPSYEGSHKDEAWNLVCKGLLAQQGEHERAFRVVEVELSFLYDFFYSKYFCFYQIGIWWQLNQLLFLGSFISVVTTYYIFRDHDRYDGLISPLGAGASRLESRQRLAVIASAMVTRTVMVIVMLLDLAQFITFITSRWAKMMILCPYISRESWKRKTAADWCINKVAQILCCIRLHENLKPWRRELSQYSLLKSYTHLQFFPRKLLNVINLITGILICTPGRKVSKSVRVSNEIKTAVILSLQKHGHHLTNGIGSLRAMRLPTEALQKLTRACSEPESDAHVILVWHIATTICEMEANKRGFGKCNDFMVAASLSNYCAYLVAFVPALLPGYPTLTDCVCNATIKDAQEHLKGCDAYDTLNKMANRVGDSESGQEGSVLQQGARLGKDLLTEIEEPRLRWEVLAGFWAEMVLFLAPNSGNEMAHAERLADGGEFITHLWALLFHAGIVDRDSFCRNNDESTGNMRSE